ncbi:DLIC-domain-containing protein [Tilletiaria anomala UBC 951]|uniref:DLIC-domain-containing protein n=1 Tax=Tilletiaria anomala (strain ATCC 24038 / CBS 436.72 / UBC 951) TaxID=1037660 RepID=A0A066W8A4_TILAU|nr:DLIC-domain-containing protein [Tilletiaria anomala UBC 951]KDN47005.1 DLIC-domain-containing protein [Tilletiaria anomala UBC 951]
MAPDTSVDLATIAAGAAASSASTNVAGGAPSASISTVAGIPPAPAPGAGAAFAAGFGETEDLWSSILNSVHSSRGVTTKNIVLLGEPATGKRTLLRALAAGSHSSFALGDGISGNSSGNINGAEFDAAPAAALASSSASIATVTAVQHPSSANAVAASNPGPGSAAAAAALLGLAYGYFDVTDDDDASQGTSNSRSTLAGGAGIQQGDVIARVGAYTLHSSHPAYTGLLALAFPTAPGEAGSMIAQAEPFLSELNQQRGHLPQPSLAALSASLILITLDWTQPQSFLDQLRRWLVIVRRMVDSASDAALSSRAAAGSGGTSAGSASSGLGWSRKWVVLDEMREALENTFRAYREPAVHASASGGGPTAAVAGAGAGRMNGTAGQASESDASSAASNAFVEPSSASAGVGGAALSSLQLPLPDGALDSESNWGVGIVIVCTKADCMGQVEAERNFKEEQFDYVQQVLRVVCLKYGAALFYISSHRPESVASLRKYILHRLFDTSSAPTGAAGATAAGAVSAATSARFRLAQRASTVDRDTVFVPAGWDTYGKIKALRGSDDSFDPKSVRRSWETDFAVELERRERVLRKLSAAAAASIAAPGSAPLPSSLPPSEKPDEADPSLAEETLRQELFGGLDGGSAARSAVQLFEDIVGDWHARAPPVAPGTKIAEPDMQAFLAQHYAALQKEPAEAKGGALGGVASASDHADGRRGSKDAAGRPMAAVDAAEDVRRGVMGPIASNGLSILPKMDTAEDAGDEVIQPVRLSKSRSSDKRERPRIDTDSLALPASRGGSRPTSPGMGGGTASLPGVPKQSEVLQSFFQSLLKDKPVTSASNKSSRSARKGTPGANDTRDTQTPPPA